MAEIIRRAKALTVSPLKASQPVGAALACGPIGYLLGLALLVPLVDRFSPRRVVALQFLALGGALASTTVAGSPKPRVHAVAATAAMMAASRNSSSEASATT